MSIPASPQSTDSSLPPAWSRRISFQVDVAGIIQIMGTSLYSRSDTPIRELLQNAHDAVQRRRLVDLSYKGQIRIRTDPEQHTLEVSDEVVQLVVSRCTESESGGRMIDAILTNTMLPDVSRAFLERLLLNQPLGGVAVGVADGQFTYRFD